MIDGTILQYEIIEKLGEGGMGEVYKARDTKLDRLVALKFLPSNLTATESEKTRFIQEAKAASALNHPNVCTIYDIHEHEGQLFIVMEYVDGITLRGKKQNYSVKQVVDIGAQAADGLSAAHEKGIVHRDIKPENIMLTKNGIAKVMDFGLAKMNNPAEASRLTKAGTTLGTIGYMSPEQVQGQDVDHRSDIFSLGVVLYELLSGESPFKGVHETAIMYEIVNVDPPPISRVKEGIDPQLDSIVLECLEKDKDDRCQSAKELAKDLRRFKRTSEHNQSRAYTLSSGSLKTGASQTIDSQTSRSITIQAFDRTFELTGMLRSTSFLWTLVVVLFVVVAYFAILKGNSQQNLITAISTINPPINVSLAGTNVGSDPGDFEISHDGRAIVFVGTDSAGKSELWLRTLNSEYAKPLPAASNPIYPFWSYDDKFVAYFSPDKLMKIDVNTGLSTEICAAPAGRGGTWNQDGDIVFAPNSTGGLYLVSSNGGEPKQVAQANSTLHGQSLRFPYFLPDGKHFLYSIENDFNGSSPSDAVKVGSINSNVNKVIFNSSTNAEFANGYIFFAKQSILFCQKFDLGDFQLSGDIQTVAGNVNYFDARIKASFSVSRAGNLVFQHGSPMESKLVLISSKGNRMELPVMTNVNELRVAQVISAALSPDMEKVLYEVEGNEQGNSEIWKYDVKTKIDSKITFNPDLNNAPCWSPDGKLVAFTSGRDVYIKNADGTGNKILAYRADSSYYKVTDDWSSDGTKLLINDLTPDAGWELVIVDLKNNDSNRYLLRTRLTTGNAKLSKDMKWVLYCSTESGTFQIYVKPVNSETGMWQVSNEGGSVGWWVDNDRAIIYLTTDGVVYKVDVNGSGSSFAVGPSHYLFNLGDKNLSGLSDVSSDGAEFLGTTEVGAATNPPITYVQNWEGLITKAGL